ncbi:hypothetical protein AUW17_08350 [Tenacibaculum dicentrarchi]|uniref:hypothetical protein n=1 Tax=Tenacibaculum piscium TaxID=1458515 RepID=UPI0007391935|nr:hypothetical protein [Tenacibaculum piscium]ALU75271.1 hypothetical protein AUW17_08350 [Tenacibaculum dicentrarchi]
MNKFTNKPANKTQNRKIILSTIGLYNQSVKDALRKRKISVIEQHAIKNFMDGAYRNKLTDAQYNEAVEQFNKSGLLLLKKGAEEEKFQEANLPQYSYINYPYLDREAFKNTMDNYRQYVYKYNVKTELENEEIRKYNSTIVEHPFQLTEAKKARKAAFEKANKKEFPRKYNELVIEENKKGAIVSKRKIQTIKPFSEMIFQVLVGFYTSQLKVRNAYLLQMKKPTSTLKKSLPKLKIDHRKLATHEIADIPRLGICKRSAQIHVKRLREAGVLINYKMINQNKPISVNFNYEIIEILDGKTPKQQLPENKSFTPLSLQNLPDNSDTTRTKNLKEKEIKGCANSTTLNESGSMLANQYESNTASPAEGYKNTSRISNKTEIRIEGGEKINLPDFLNKPVAKKKTDLLSINFLNRLENEKDFSAKLANGEFDNYRGMRYDYLQKIEQYGLLSTDEFKQVVIEDFIKSSAKIWKKHSVYVGEWKKTINLLKTQLFKNLTHKSTVIKKLKELRWKLEFARTWFLKKEDVNALFPFSYFDKTRTNSNELGFYGLHSIWKSHLKYQEKKAKNDKELAQNSSARKRKLSTQKKLTRAISKYDLGQFTYKQLFSYVQDNLPHDYLILLPALIKTENTNLA